MVGFNMIDYTDIFTKSVSYLNLFLCRMSQENNRPTYSSIKTARPTGDQPKGEVQVNNQHKQIITKTMQHIKEYLKICHDLSSSYCDVFNRKMMEDIETLEEVIIRSAPAQFDEDPSKISKLFERIMASLNASSARLMNLIVESKRQQLIGAYKVFFYVYNCIR